MTVRARVDRRSGARNTELIAAVLAVLLVPAVLVKFLFNGSRISFTAINFIQLAIMVGLLNLTVHLGGKVARWVTTPLPTRRRSRAAASAEALAVMSPAPTPPESRPPVR